MIAAANKGDASTVALLLSRGARVDARCRGFTPLLVAVQLGHTEVCKLLLDQGKAKIEEAMPGGATALIVAANKGNASIVALLLSRGARVNVRDQGFTPLLIAAQFGHNEACELLLDEGKANIEETEPDGETQHPWALAMPRQ